MASPFVHLRLLVFSHAHRQDSPHCSAWSLNNRIDKWNERQRNASSTSWIGCYLLFQERKFCTKSRSLPELLVGSSNLPVWTKPEFGLWRLSTFRNFETLDNHNFRTKMAFRREGQSRDSSGSNVYLEKFKLSKLVQDSGRSHCTRWRAVRCQTEIRKELGNWQSENREFQ